MMMLLRRSMAHKFDLQLSHQGAARSVSGMAAMLAHEIRGAGSEGVARCSNGASRGSNIFDLYVRTVAISGAITGGWICVGQPILMVIGGGGIPDTRCRAGINTTVQTKSSQNLNLTHEGDLPSLDTAGEQACPWIAT